MTEAPAHAVLLLSATEPATQTCPTRKPTNTFGFPLTVRAHHRDPRPARPFRGVSGFTDFLPEARLYPLGQFQLYFGYLIEDKLDMAFPD